MVEVEITQDTFDFVKGRREKGYYPSEIIRLSMWHRKVRVTNRQIELILNSPDMGTLTHKETEQRRKKIKSVLETGLQTAPFVTTKEIKEVLRHTFPTENWRQSDVSKVVDSIYIAGEISGLTFHDNGEYREYMIVTPAAQKTIDNIVAKTVKLYTITHGASTFIGTSQQLETITQALNIPIHYSETKDEFIAIDAMHKNHLENVINRDLGNLFEEEDLSLLITYFESSPYIKSWKDKYLK